MPFIYPASTLVGVLQFPRESTAILSREYWNMTGKYWQNPMNLSMEHLPIYNMTLSVLCKNLPITCKLISVIKKTKPHHTHPHEPWHRPTRICH